MLARCVEVSVEEARAPLHLQPRLRAALRSRGWWWRIPGERVRGSLLRPGRRRRSSERRRDASLTRPSILLVRVIRSHPVQVWFARHDTGRTGRTVTYYIIQQDISRHTAVTTEKFARHRRRHDGVTGTRYQPSFCHGTLSNLLRIQRVRRSLKRRIIAACISFERFTKYCIFPRQKTAFRIRVSCCVALLRRPALYRAMLLL